MAHFAPASALAPAARPAPRQPGRRHGHRPRLRHDGRPRRREGRQLRPRGAARTTSATRSAARSSAPSPQKYLAPQRAGAARRRRPGHDVRLPDGPGGARRTGPGACPKCGMALEPVAPRAGDADRVDLPDAPGDRARRAGAAARSAAWRSSRARSTPRRRPNPELRRHDAALLGQRCAHRAARRCSRCRRCCPGSRCSTLGCRRRCAWLQLALATPVVLWGGWPFFERGWASLRQPAA